MIEGIDWSERRGVFTKGFFKVDDEVLAEFIREPFGGMVGDGGSGGAG